MVRMTPIWSINYWPKSVVLLPSSKAQPESILTSFDLNVQDSCYPCLILSAHSLADAVAIFIYPGYMLWYTYFATCTIWALTLQQPQTQCYVSFRSHYPILQAIALYALV